MEGSQADKPWNTEYGASNNFRVEGNLTIVILLSDQSRILDQADDMQDLIEIDKETTQPKS